MERSYAQAGTGRLPAVAAGGEASVMGEALDGMLTAARRTLSLGRTGRMRADVTAPQPAPVDSERLRDAFRVFTDAADRLEGTYASLKARVDELSGELARANEALTVQLEDKQALLERQSALLAALPAGVLLIGADGLVREANAAAERLLGASFVGRAWSLAAAGLVPAGSKYEWATPGPQPRRINLQEQRIDASGERIVLLHDITDAHEARVVQERNERLASMGEMAARMAHQLRTPLATAMLYAGQLKRTDIAYADRAGLGEKILGRLRSLERMTRDMLRFVRGEQAVELPIDLGALLSEAAHTVEPIMAARGIRFACEDHTAGVVLHGDRRGLSAALTSLLENAAQVTTQGGRVRIAAMANSMRVRIEVSDCGPGIPDEVLPRLFEPFFSTRDDGTGLGLAIVKRVVEAHGGSVSVETSAHAGTSFTVTLPCTNESPIQVAPLPRVRVSMQHARDETPCVLAQEAA